MTVDSPVPDSSGAAAQSQISISYQHMEDRLLLRIACDGRDSRIWLTRRMVKNFFQARDKLYELLEDGQYRDPAEKAIQDFKEEAAMHQADLSIPYHADGLEPFPKDGPLLAVKIKFTPLKNGRIRLVFLNPDDLEAPFSLGPSDFRMLVHLVTEGMAKAKWALEPAKAGMADGPSGVMH
ncbi:hypothetical protein [Aestuariispira insulae]|nr:hypothetical protein [Aestuariispira insulae]